MEPKTISVTELRLSAAEILGAARFGGQHFIVQRFGRPMVAIVGVEEYRRLVSVLNQSQPGNQSKEVVNKLGETSLANNA